jgi:transposase
MSRVHTEEFKQDAVRLLERTGRSYSQVSADLGISYWTLRNWYKALRMGKRLKKEGPGKAAAAPVSAETAEEKMRRLEKENARLRKENETLQMERAILKKAATFFAKESE